MGNKLDLLRRRLRQDGLCIRAFVLIGATVVWDYPNWNYVEALRLYADYEGDAPERVHADLCRRLLAAGKEIGPEKYFAGIGEEMINCAD